jgi:hypothetical protein
MSSPHTGKVNGLLVKWGIKSGNPHTGKVNGLLVKWGIKSGNLQFGHPCQKSVINGHGAYVNFLTQQHQSGDIRGQIPNKLMWLRDYAMVTD